MPIADPFEKIDAVHGDPDALVDVTHDEIARRAAAAVGGADVRDAVLKWAGGVLSEDQRQEYDRRLADPNQAVRTVEELRNRYERAHASPADSPPPQGFGTSKEFGAALDAVQLGEADADTFARIAATDDKVIRNG